MKTVKSIWDKMSKSEKDAFFKFQEVDKKEFLDSLKWLGSFMMKDSKMVNGYEVCELPSGEDVVILKDGVIKTILNEYEGMNCFIFSDVVILPGHDAISLFCTRTGEKRKEYIR